MRPVIFIKPISLPKLPHYVPLWQRFVEYPKFTPGDSPTRCFLVPFWMKMMYPGTNNPPDHVVFKVHPQMTSYDVQQYLEKIYHISVLNVRVKMLYHDLEPNDIPAETALKRKINPFIYPPKAERYEKLAYVRLAPGVNFRFPDLFKVKRPSQIMTELDEETTSSALNSPTSSGNSAPLTTESAAATSNSSDSIVSPSKPYPKTVKGGLSRLPKWFIPQL